MLPINTVTHSKLLSAPVPVYDPPVPTLPGPRTNYMGHYSVLSLVSKSFLSSHLTLAHLSPPSQISPVLSVHLNLTLHCLGVVFHLTSSLTPQEVGPHQPILRLPSASEAVSLARGTNRLCVCESADWSCAISPSDHWSRK